MVCPHFCDVQHCCTCQPAECREQIASTPWTSSKTLCLYGWRVNWSLNLKLYNCCTEIDLNVDAWTSYRKMQKNHTNLKNSTAPQKVSSHKHKGISPPLQFTTNQQYNKPGVLDELNTYSDTELRIHHGLNSSGKTTTTQPMLFFDVIPINLLDIIY